MWNLQQHSQILLFRGLDLRPQCGWLGQNEFVACSLALLSKRRRQPCRTNKCFFAGDFVCHIPHSEQTSREQLSSQRFGHECMTRDVMPKYLLPRKCQDLKTRSPRPASCSMASDSERLNRYRSNRVQRLRFESQYTLLLFTR